MKISQLRGILDVAAKRYRIDGHPDKADALSVFAEKLLTDKDSTVSAFVKRVEQARKRTEAPAARRGSAKRASVKRV